MLKAFFLRSVLVRKLESFVPPTRPGDSSLRFGMTSFRYYGP
jgi:hypothetical protein